MYVPHFYQKEYSSYRYPLYAMSSRDVVSTITSQLVEAFVEFILFGVFAVLSPVSLVLQLRRHRDMYGTFYYPGDGIPLWRRWLSVIWRLRKSPLLIATVVLILTTTAVCLVT